MQANAVLESVEVLRPGIIGIDGDLGAGKSSLSRWLSTRLALPVIHLDDHLNAGGSSFVESIDRRGLRRAIDTAGRPVIVEGICLLAAMDTVGLQPDLHYYLKPHTPIRYKRGSALVEEVADYRGEAEKHANGVITMGDSPTNHLDVDIAYLRSKTIVSVVLSLGGIASLVVGAYIISSGISATESAVLEIAGAKLTAEGLGAVVMGTAAFWGYFAYRARPKYSRRSETRSVTAADGSREDYSYESATMLIQEPHKP